MTLRISFMTLATLGLVAGCADPGYQGGGYRQGMNPANEPNRTVNGAVTGALVGGALGIGTGRHGAGRGVVGAALGGLIGGAVGNALDRQAAELRQNIANSSVSVTNTGSALIVNLPQDILFATDSANLRPDLTSDLGAVAQSLLNYPATTVQVIGHTDNTGSASYNQDLSQRRAQTVADILREDGVPGGRIIAIGRGEEQPVATNMTEAGKALNRRVEIVIIPNRNG